MKKYFLPIRFAFFILVLILNLFQNRNCIAQNAGIDTVRIQSLIDSCKSLPDVQYASILLKQIQANLAKVKNEKEKGFFQRAEIKTMRNIGSVYKNSLFNLPKAMEFYQMSRKKSEASGNKIGIAAALLNIGSIYSDLNDYIKALDNYERSLKMFQEIQDDRGIGICYNNMGSIYKNQTRYTQSLEYYQKSLQIQEARADTFEIMTCFINIAFVYEKLPDNIKAKEFFEKGKKFAEKINNTDGIIRSQVGLGNILMNTGKQGEAEKYYSEAMKLAVESGDLFIQSEVANSLRTIYELKGNFKDALAMDDRHFLLRDSISNQSKIKEIALRDAKYESDKREATMQAIAEGEKKKSRIIILSVLSGLFLVIVFAGFIFRSLRITRKQKDIIELQKGEVEKQKKKVEEHQKEIIDSITYAKRLQEAILPPLAYVKKHLPNYFISYVPKDIVAGDFYWMEEIDNIIFLAAADCTGHGVPGAMVSVVCSNALNRTVKEFRLRDTGKILDKVTELVVETFEKSDKDVMDGMDISLLAINRLANTVQWSGANNPLWYIHEEDFFEITANKQPIGKHDNRVPFTAHTIDNKPNTTFYLFTDGYADQFGGPKAKKFKYKQFKEKIIESNDMPGSEQKKFLEKIFFDWKGELEQVDDVCIIGIRI